MIFTVRIKSSKDFNRLYSKGAFVSCGLCTVYFRKNGQRINRIGISTGKKIGCAVKRSRARRVIRQAYRECESLFPAGFDMIVAARQGSTECKTVDVVGFFKAKVIPAMRNPDFCRKSGGKKTAVSRQGGVSGGGRTGNGSGNPKAVKGRK